MSLMKRVKGLVFAFVLGAGLVLIGLSGRTSATDADYTYSGEPKVIAATFSSAWCSACKILEPRLSKIIPDFAEYPIKFIELDFTFGQHDEIEALAQREGIADVYPKFEGATGFTLLVDRETGEIIDMLTIDHNQNAMRAAIAQAIAITQRDEPQ